MLNIILISNNIVLSLNNEDYEEYIEDDTD